jgi:hypothetical protein
VLADALVSQCSVATGQTVYAGEARRRSARASLRMEAEAEERAARRESSGTGRAEVVVWEWVSTA